MSPAEFTARQRQRRQELWKLLGDLPEPRPVTTRIEGQENGPGYQLTRLTLDLNGLQPVPALWLVPASRRQPGPALLYIHWHGGDYPLGKESLIRGHGDIQPWADDLLRLDLAVLAIDSWCFGRRMPCPDDGRRGEEDTFKEMLWRGRVLFGMMIFDEWQALNWLCTRPEVDARRIGAMGMSMGATKAWWLAALDERVRCCVDICCLTDFEALIARRCLHLHGIYYYVPGLLKSFQTHQINELIVPRRRLSVNGSRDLLTPPEGVQRVRDHLMPLYERYGREEDCRIELYDCGHELTPAMRTRVLDWLRVHLAAPL